MTDCSASPARSCRTRSAARRWSSRAAATTPGRRRCGGAHGPRRPHLTPAGARCFRAVQATTDLAWRDAVELAASIRARELSAVELLEHHLERIARIDPAVNSIVTLDADGARAQAAAADAALARGDGAGPLHGLPVAVKDLADTAGVRTTYGSPVYRDHVPEADELVVERLRAAGAVIVGKTNTPEFGAGSQTFNPVFGVTRNPYDLDRTGGGSSGGAAAAVACGLVPLADASDLASSIRNPASFCNVVGLRPTPGPSRTVRGRRLGLDVRLGPIARSVRDTALYLRAVAGPDPRDPRPTRRPPGRPRARARGRRRRYPRRVEPRPPRPAGGARGDSRPGAGPGRAGRLGCTVVDAAPDLAIADEAFEPCAPSPSSRPSLTTSPRIPTSSRTPSPGTSRKGSSSAGPTSRGRLHCGRRRSAACARSWDPRRAGAAGRAGGAVPVESSGRTRSPAADAALRRLDAVLFAHHGGRLPRDRGARRLHAGGPAGGAAARRPAGRRACPAAGRPRLRASDAARAAAAVGGLRVEIQRLRRKTV